MPTPIERILAEWSRIATDLTRGGYDDPADALDAAITAALEAEREMRDCWRSFRDHPNDDYSRSVLNRHLGGE